MKLDLLTNATVVDDAIRFVSQDKQKIKSASSKDDKEEANEHDYDEEQLKEQKEEEAGEITTNQVF